MSTNKQYFVFGTKIDFDDQPQREIRSTIESSNLYEVVESFASFLVAAGFANDQVQAALFLKTNRVDIVEDDEGDSW